MHIMTAAPSMTRMLPVHMHIYLFDVGLWSPAIAYSGYASKLI
jgi:hypothetical protein